MQVEVRLYGALRRYRPSESPGTPHSTFTVKLPDGATLDNLSRLLNIPDGVVNAAAVNNQAVIFPAVLHDGDRVSLFPPAAGGWLTPNPAARTIN